MRLFGRLRFYEEDVLDTLRELAGEAEVKETTGYPFFPDGLPALR